MFVFAQMPPTLVLELKRHQLTQGEAGLLDESLAEGDENFHG